MPFITEDLWHDEVFGERTKFDCCIVAQMPLIGQINTQLTGDVELIKQLIGDIRNTRNSKQLSPKESLSLMIKVNSRVDYQLYQPIIIKLGNISEIDFVNDKVAGATSFLVQTDEFYIPLGGHIDTGAERERLQNEDRKSVG